MEEILNSSKIIENIIIVVIVNEVRNTTISQLCNKNLTSIKNEGKIDLAGLK